MQSKKSNTRKSIAESPDDIRILQEMFDSWEVEVFIKRNESTEDLLPKILKRVKSYLTENFAVDEQLVRYKKMTGNRKTDVGMFVSLFMERVPISKMTSKLSVQSMLSEEGVPYDEMACFANLQCKDEFGNQLSKERLIELIKNEGVLPEYIDMKAVEEAIAQLANTNKPIENIKLASGKFPGPGTDAIIEFYFQSDPAEDDFQEYLKSRKVESGFLLCEKIPPVPGSKKGKTIRGRDIPPGKGLDVQLVAGKNVSIDVGKTQLTASLGGIALVSREEKPLVTPSGLKVVPSKIIIDVDILEVIETIDTRQDITSSGSIAIVGQLSAGSKIISGGEVHIDGNVSEKTFIQASHSVIVNGMVWKGGISSDKSIITTGKVIDGTLSATENIIVRGNINSSTVSAKDIYAENINGGSIFAGNQLVATALGTDIDGNAATICVGMKEFLGKKIGDNIKLIETLTERLNKLTEIFGEEIVREIREDNLQQMLFKFIAVKKSQRGGELTKKDMESHRKLMLSIVSIREILFQKKKDNKKFGSLSKQIKAEKKMLIVKEKVTAKSIININNTKKVIKPQQGPLELNEAELMDLEGIYE